MHTNTTTEQNVTAANSNVSWKAILGGVVIALSITIVFNLVGLGLGFTAFLVDSNTLSVIKISSVLWLLLCSIFSMFAGGWAAARLSSFTYDEPETILSGLITWGIVTLACFSLMASSMGALLSGGLSLIERTATVATQAASSGLNAVGRIAPGAVEVAQNAIPDMKKLISKMSEQAEPLFDNLKSQTTSEEQGDNKSISKETAKKRLEGIISSALNAETEEEKSSAKNEATKFLTQSLNMNEQKAQETITNWQSKYDEAKAQMARKAEEAKNKAVLAAESASHTIGKVALITAMINLFGALAAVIGSIIGYRKRI